jgi:hypothetical protein
MRSVVFAHVFAHVLALAGFVAAGVVGCGGAGAAPKTSANASPSTNKPAPLDDKSGFEGKDIGVYRSDRLGLDLPLLDRTAWIIIDRDDDNGGWLVATHARTQTVMRVRRYAETTLVGRMECSARATLVGELPRDDVRVNDGWETLSDEPLHRPKGWDGWRWVAFQPVAGGKVVGHVFLIAGRAHDCLVVHVRAESADAQADALADRLELFASRVVPMITVDRAAEPEMIKPEIPGVPNVGP